jgi:hypothetical protein
VDKLWNSFKGSPDKPYMTQPRVKRGIDEKILVRVVADQIQPEVWMTSKQGERQPAQTHRELPLRRIDGVAQPGDIAGTPDLERKLNDTLFQKTPAAKSEASVIQRVLKAGPGICIGNPLLRDERVKIKYDDAH